MSATKDTRERRGSRTRHLGKIRHVLPCAGRVPFLTLPQSPGFSCARTPKHRGRVASPPSGPAAVWLVFGAFCARETLPGLPLSTDIAKLHQRRRDGVSNAAACDSAGRRTPSRIGP
ncbi:hypothetical protein PsYK624_009470 [Phanerochaete sordida]|uniref:Uncharacterized protein n=1 Tax=Phanerochaete sordida TaxID=48140 RepID=A0A9P3FYG3_9APHY|nr:hypothetical protein PsYK624_009470 [Phanerochaete sordida]